jgi:hypothetical protein
LQIIKHYYLILTSLYQIILEETEPQNLPSSHLTSIGVAKPLIIASHNYQMRNSLPAKSSDTNPEPQNYPSRYAKQSTSTTQVNFMLPKLFSCRTPED